MRTTTIGADGVVLQNDLHRVVNRSVDEEGVVVEEIPDNNDDVKYRESNLAAPAVTINQLAVTGGRNKVYNAFTSNCIHSVRDIQGKHGRGDYPGF